MYAKIAYGFWKKISVSSVRSLSCEKKVKEIDMLIEKSKREKPKTMRTSENIAAVVESVRAAPLTLIHRCSQ